MANEFTLADYERTAPDNLVKAVVRTWREKSPILDMLTFKTSDLLSQEVLRLQEVPTVPWRKISEDFTQLKVETDKVGERLHFMGAKIDVPYEYVKAGNMIDLRAIQEQAIMEGVALEFNRAFFRNAPTDDEDAITGIHYRIHNDLGSDQKFDASLDISPDTAEANAAHLLMDKIEDLLSRVDGEDSQKVLFMNKTVKMRIRSLFRQSGALKTTEDGIGRQFDTYNGAKFVDVGYQADQSTKILTDTENATALTGGTDSSIFCVRFGEPYLSGWCQEMPMAEDVGLLESRTAYRTVVRFSPGLYQVQPRAMAQAYGFTAA